MDALLRAMDETGVTESVVIGMPVVKQWDEGDSKRPTYYLDNDSRTYWYSATDFLVARAVQDLPSGSLQVRDAAYAACPWACDLQRALSSGRIRA